MTSQKRFTYPIWARILTGLVIGCLIGLFFPDLGSKLQPVGTAFIKAIKMIVMPLVFSAVTLGIYQMGSDIKQLGKLGGFAFLWFYLATGFAITVGIILSMVFQPGAGVDLSMAAGAAIPKNLATSIDWSKFFLDIIPDNIVAAMAQQKIIPTLFFAICFGLCLGGIGEKAKPVVNLLEGVLQAMFKLTRGIIKTAPFAVAAIMSWVFATQGSDAIFALMKLVGVMYLGLIILSAVFLIILKILGESPIAIIKKVAEPLILAFSTASSEVTLPVHMEILTRSGVPPKVVSFVLPLGYSFNLDGAALAQSLYVCFLVQACNLPMDIPTLLTILLTTLIANKGTANVPSASLVVVATIMSSLGIPLEAIGVLLAIDWFTNSGRTTLNVFGNTVAVLLLYRIGGKNLEEAVDKVLTEEGQAKLTT